MDLNRVDLNLLVAFDALMSEGSVSRAAQRLHVGQSAMSSTLGRLRDLLDDPVLVRDGRRMVPTPLALSLMAPVREALDRVEMILSATDGFDAAQTQRTFTVIGSDYTSLTFVNPLIDRLNVDAPGIKIRLIPPGDDYTDRLRRGQADLVIMPRAVFTEHRSFPNVQLFQDRFVCAVDADNAAVGETISLRQFSSLPYLATSCGHEISSGEAQLDRLGIARNTKVTTAMGLAPILVSGSDMITLIQERLAWIMAPRTTLRLLEPPMSLRPIHQLMLWAPRSEDDPGHRWLRQRLIAMADELTGPAARQPAAGQTGAALT
ncbi:MAG: LysR family transcriptional regulator [Actinobacteria bacterium]|nr:LysR family transcriptional regulator [Actinomycetota bacterium]